MSRQAIFNVTLSSPSTSTVQVVYTTQDGTLTGGTSLSGSVDFVRQSGVLVFSPGDTVKPITISIRPTDQSRSSGQFYLRLSSPSGATLNDITGTCALVGVA